MEDSIKSEVNRREVYRYLGLGRHEPDERTALLVEESLVELENAAAPRFFSRSYPLSVLPDGKLDLTCFRVESRDLSRNLKDCQEVILLAATLGTCPDLMVRRYSRLEMSRAVVVQAAAAAMIEAWCDRKNGELKEEALRQGKYLRPRFSPGYGDFSLDCQKDIIRALEAEKTVGVTLTDSLLMTPSKSVTAVIGAGRNEFRCELKGCEVCGKTDCLYRRG